MSKYSYPSKIVIHQNALVENYQYFQKSSPSTICTPVIKSNAYGHGLVEIARITDKHLNPPYLCVDNLGEANTLKANRIKTPILVLGATNPINLTGWKKLPYTFMVSDIDTIQALSKYQPGSKVHIKVDTGMNRLGFRFDQLERCIEVIKKIDTLEFEGIASHLSCADDKKEDEFTKTQINRFNQAIRQFRHAGFLFKWRHLSNTAGASRIKEADFNLSRVGIGLYGLTPFNQASKIGREQRLHLKPTLSLISQLVHIKEVKTGESIGYNNTYLAKNGVRIGIVPLGYSDGIERKLSNRGYVLIDGVACPIVGKISMNMTTIDISEVRNAHLGQTAIVISNIPGEKNTIENMSRLANTSHHELLSRLSPQIPREISNT